MDASSHNLQTIFFWPCKAVKLRNEPQPRTKDSHTHPDKSSQTSSYSNTHPALLKVSSFQEQNQPCYLSTPFSRLFFPFPCPVAYSLGRKPPSFQFVTALDSLSITVSVTWDCLWRLGGYFITAAERGNSLQSDTREYTSEKILQNTDILVTWLCLICSTTF